MIRIRCLQQLHFRPSVLLSDSSAIKCKFPVKSSFPCNDNVIISVRLFNRKPNSKLFAGCGFPPRSHCNLRNQLSPLVEETWLLAIGVDCGWESQCWGVSYLLCLSSLALVIPIFAAPHDASCMNMFFCMHALLLCAFCFFNLLVQRLYLLKLSCSFKRFAPFAFRHTGNRSSLSQTSEYQSLDACGSIWHRIP